MAYFQKYVFKIKFTPIVLISPSRTGKGVYMSDLVITDQNFNQEVNNSDLPVLVDFWAVWCGPCRMQGPIIDELVKDFSGKAKIGKLNVDENPVMAQKYGVMSIPTIMIFSKGTVVKQYIGVQSKDTLKSELNKLIN